jgi:hypothetical protein
MSEYAAVAPHPHPLVGQLSALQHFRTYIDIAVVVVVLAITNLIATTTLGPASPLCPPPQSGSSSGAVARPGLGQSPG